ncbi:hypothetical protein ACJZ2D_006365 [Fusarium nematophilum]
MAGQTAQSLRRPTSSEECDQAPKRRRIRKGTTSCWECKRRKIKCHFPSPTSDICNGCRQRETPCVTQEYEDSAVVPEEISTTEISNNGIKHKGLENRLERVEALLEQLLDSGICLPPSATGRRTPEAALASYLSLSDGTKRCSTASAPAFTGGLVSGRMTQVFDTVLVGTPGLDTFPSRLLTIYQGDADTYYRGNPHHDLPPKSYDYERISAELHSTLPSQRDADLIIAAGNTAPFLQFLCRPYGDLFRGRMLPASSLSSLPSPKSHPVLLARVLLYLAHGMQNLHPAAFDLDQLDLGCTPAAAMQRFLNTACRLVTSSDELIESLEGLECLVLEGVFHINSGNLRRAWRVFRRSISLAQLLGLHRGDHADLAILDSSTMASPSFMWHRIVSQDRYLALMLDLPPGTSDDILGNPDDLGPDDCPMGYLERIHCIIMSRITANKSGKADSEDSVNTWNIDSELQKAARGMPSDWWQLPTAKGRSAGRKDNLEDVLRILFHITHFSLLIYLRLPQMLHSADEDLNDPDKSACVSASRELLKRYIRFRCMDSVAFCCTSIDFSAFTACLTLLLAHLRRWHRNPDLGDGHLHQRLSDRDMVQETVELMMELGQESGDTVLEKTAGIVTSLARIETDAAKHAGLYGDVGFISRRSASALSVEVMVPTFGAVSITRNGVFPRHPGRYAENRNRGHKEISTSQDARPSLPVLGLSQELETRMPSASYFEFDTGSHGPELPDMPTQAYLQDLDSLECYGLWRDEEVDPDRRTTFTASNHTSALSFSAETGGWDLNTGSDEQGELLSEFLDSLSRT